VPFNSAPTQSTADSGPTANLFYIEGDEVHFQRENSQLLCHEPPLAAIKGKRLILFGI